MDRIHWIVISISLLALTVLTTSNQKWEDNNYFDTPADVYELPIITQPFSISDNLSYIFKTSDCILSPIKSQVAVETTNTFAVKNNCLHSVFTVRENHKPP